MYNTTPATKTVRINPGTRPRTLYDQGKDMMARQMYSEKSNAAVFCQLQVRYWIAWPFSRASCLSRMAEEVDSSLSEVEVKMEDWMGRMRGPMGVFGPPKREDQDLDLGEGEGEVEGGVNWGRGDGGFLRGSWRDMVPVPVVCRLGGLWLCWGCQIAGGGWGFVNWDWD